MHEIVGVHHCCHDSPKGQYGQDILYSACSARRRCLVLGEFYVLSESTRGLGCSTSQALVNVCCLQGLYGVFLYEKRCIKLMFLKFILSPATVRIPKVRAL